MKVTGGRGEGGMVNSTQAPEKRESAPKGKVQSITDTKFPSVLQQQGKRWVVREGGDTSGGVRG